MKKIAVILLIITFVVTFSSLTIAEMQLPQNYLEHFKPITMKFVDNPNNPVTPVKVKLGKMLYHDPRLSKSGLFSCNTCHNIATYGMSNLPVDIGHKWALGPVNSGTVFNAAFYKAQFWDGRAKDLEEQAKGPILDPLEMAMPNEQAAVDRIKSIPEYRKLFSKAFPEDKESLTFDNIANAIAAFERTLLTPSRFDKFLLGDEKAINNEEKKGLKLFVNVGCVSCHNGIALGGDFQKLGVVKPYNTKNPSKGRYNVTKRPEDMNMFKMTTLRNIEMTYPYFHDGQVWTLDEAVKIMADIQLGKTLKDDEVRTITAFLRLLTGEIPKDALQLPVLPPSTKDTARPSHE